MKGISTGKWQAFGFGVPILVGGLLVVDAGSVAAQTPTYAKDIAPLLQQSCQQCHRPGSVAPFSLLTYEDARRWASVIKVKTAERQMPPWPLDKTIGIQHFKNDVSLTDEQIAMIGAWVDGGTPRGNPADEPAALVFKDYSNTWQYEERYGRPPDLIVRSPAYNVLANGLDQWPDPETTITDLDRPRWLRAIEFRPGTPNTRYVFHHANPSLTQDGGNTGLIAAAVGKTGEIFPENTGKLIKPGATVSFGMHYFPIGEEVEAVMELGLWFYDDNETPKYVTPGEVQHRADMTTGAGGYNGHNREIARRSDLVIPPNSMAQYKGTYVLDRPARIHSLRGHMHLRGKYQIVEATFPDGRHEIINKLNWDHGWHTTFLYEDDYMPLLPKGTVLTFTSIFDNTVNNHDNPDPDQWVVAGSRTVDEMSHVWVGMTYFDNQADFDAMVAERERNMNRVTNAGSAAN